MGLETVVGKRQSEGCVGWKKIRASLEIENSRDWLEHESSASPDLEQA